LQPWRILQYEDRDLDYYLGSHSIKPFPEIDTSHYFEYLEHPIVENHHEGIVNAEESQEKVNPEEHQEIINHEECQEIVNSEEYHDSPTELKKLSEITKLSEENVESPPNMLKKSRNQCRFDWTDYETEQLVKISKEMLNAGQQNLSAIARKFLETTTTKNLSTVRRNIRKLIKEGRIVIPVQKFKPWSKDENEILRAIIEDTKKFTHTDTIKQFWTLTNGQRRFQDVSEQISKIKNGYV
jgi:hypothetical protein